MVLIKTTARQLRPQEQLGLAPWQELQQLGQQQMTQESRRESRLESMQLGFLTLEAPRRCRRIR